MRELLLSGGHVALVDDDVWIWASNHTWRLQKQGYVCRTVSLPGRRKGTLLLHREVLAAPPGAKVAPRNGDKLDCRRQNLEVLSAAGRSARWAAHLPGRGPNANSRSGYRGVAWESRRGCWLAVITLFGKQKYLGSFPTAEAAARAWDRAAREAWGQRAYQNLAP